MAHLRGYIKSLACRKPSDGMSVLVWDPPEEDSEEGLEIKAKVGEREREMPKAREAATLGADGLNPAKEQHRKCTLELACTRGEGSGVYIHPKVVLRGLLQMVFISYCFWPVS